MDWDKLRIFYAVAEAGSLTHAEEMLHISHSAISRHINQLESDFKIPLFHRHARGLRLTAAGEILHGSVRNIYGTLEHAKNRISATKDTPQGNLRVSTPLGLGAAWLTQRIKKFHDAYPAMEMNMLFQDKIVDVSMGEADIALRLARPTGGDAICQPFMKIKFCLYARRDYLENFDTPKQISDLSIHNMITLDTHQTLPLRYFNWFMEGNEDIIKPTLTVDNPYGIYRAVQCGFGIGTVPNVLISSKEDEARDDLVTVLPESAAVIQSYFVYPSELRGTNKIKVFKDFLLEEGKAYEAEWDS